MSRPQNLENLMSLADQLVWALQEYQGVYEHQEDVVLSQDNPISTGTYSVLTENEKVRLISVSASVTWTVQPSPLEIIVLIDNDTILHKQVDPVSTTQYSAIVTPGTANNSQGMDSTGLAGGRAFLYEGKEVRVQARTTGGTVSNLTCRVKWAKIES